MLNATAAILPSGFVMMRSERAALSVHSDQTQQVASEIDRLLEKHVELLRAESFVGLTPVQRQEYEKISKRLHELFRELATLRQDR